MSILWEIVFTCMYFGHSYRSFMVHPQNLWTSNQAVSGIQCHPVVGKEQSWPYLNFGPVFLGFMFVFTCGQQSQVIFLTYLQTSRFILVLLSISLGQAWCHTLALGR